MLYRNVLQVFHDALLCLTMFMKFYYDNAGPCGIIAAGIGDNSAEIGDDEAGIVDIVAKVIPF